MTTSATIEWILFDWGKVLVDYRPLGLAKLAGRLDVEPTLLGSFLRETRLLEQLTVGAITPEAGLDHIAERFTVRLTRAQAAECFRADVEHELPGIRALIAELRPKYRLAILSNAFFGHWDHFEGSELYSMFERPMASHLIGAVKPSPAAYEIALQRLEAAPERVVFIDDKPENVEAARAAGMHAFVTNSVATTRAGLSALLAG
jgi:putative hydrolase of the HAD superfamily